MMKRLNILLLLLLALSCSKRKVELYGENKNNVSVKGGPEGARGSESSQALMLQERMNKEDITSTEALVDSLNAAQTPEEQQALQQWIHPYVGWFTQQPIETLTPADLQEYTCLTHIQADRPENKQLLKSYFYSLCNKIKQDQFGEKPLIQALEYTLQTMDSAVFEGDPAPLIRLGNTLLAKPARRP